MSWNDRDNDSNRESTIFDQSHNKKTRENSVIENFGIKNSGIKNNNMNNNGVKREWNKPNDVKNTHFSRRRFLKITSLAIAGVSLVNTALYAGVTNSNTATLPPQIKHLTPSEYAVFNHLMEVAVPVSGTNLPSPDKISALITLDNVLLAGMAPHILAELKQGIQFFNDGPRQNYRNKTFTQLSSQQATEFCDAWANASKATQRGIVVGLKKLVGLAYWSHPSTWPALNYVGPITQRKGIPALGNAPLPV